MNVYQVKLTQQADMQFEETAYYIAVELSNPDASEKLVDEIFDGAEKLSFNPEKYRTIDEQPWGQKGVRKKRVKNYYVYYWIDIEESTVWIIGVVFIGRDQREFLKTLVMR